MSESTLLRVKNVHKVFPAGQRWFGKPKGHVQAVSGVSFAIKRGETLGLVGESGCGKTTLGRCIIRLEEPTRGRIILDGQDFTRLDRDRLRRARQQMQMVFQDPFSSIDSRMTVRSIIAEGLIIQKLLSRQDREARIDDLLETVGLRPEHGNRYPHEFSGGQRQRICVARALALQPKLVIADEPVSALDVSIQAQILNLFVELQQQFQLTYLFISHDLSVVRHISDRVAVMYLGQLVEIASSRHLFKRPHHPYTAALISAIPSTNPERRTRRQALAGDVPSPLRPPPGCRFHPRCPRSKALCRSTGPELTERSPGHRVACHFPLNP